MSKKEEIIQRIEKVRRLAKEGVDGEKQSAQLLLDSLMKRYGLTEEDFENEEKPTYHYIKLEGAFAIKLFCQICGLQNREIKVWNTESKGIKTMFRKLAQLDEPTKGKNTMIECTNSEFVEIMAKYEIYQRSLDEHAKAFFYSFLLKNNLLAPSDGKNGKEPTEEEVKMVERAIGMAAGVEQVQVYKQIGSGEEGAA